MFRLLDTPTPNAGPSVHVTQDDAAFVIRAELPGVKPEDISITAEKNRLTIAGKRTIVRDEKATYRRRERVEGSFERAFALPQPFDVDKIEARYVDGILTVTLPKSAEAKPRSIAVKREEGGQ
jgi:HSP20 family protein